MSLKQFLVREAPQDRVDVTLFLAPSKIFVGHMTRDEGEPASAYLAASYRNRQEYRLVDALLTEMRKSRVMPAVAHEVCTVQVVYSVSLMTEALHEPLGVNKALRVLKGRIRRLAVVSTAEVSGSSDAYRVFRRCAHNHHAVQLRILGLKGGMQRFLISEIREAFQTFVD